MSDPVDVRLRQGLDAATAELLSRYDAALADGPSPSAELLDEIAAARDRLADARDALADQRDDGLLAGLDISGHVTTGHAAPPNASGQQQAGSAPPSTPST